MKTKSIIILIILGLLMVGSCKVDICMQEAYRQKIGNSDTRKNIVTSKTSGDLNNTMDNPLILTETLHGRRWFPYDSIHNTVHACGKFNDLTQEWEAKTWVGFPDDIFIPKDRHLVLSTVNCIVRGNIYGEGTIELKGCNSTLVVQGIISSTIIKSIADGSNIIIDTPLDNNDYYSNIEIVEVPCDWELPKLTTENGIRYYYTKKQ